jgi:cell division septation protein DedD
MSMREEGLGLEAVPPHKFQSNFASQSINETIPAGPAWSVDQHQLSEEANMSSGTTKPSAMGQRSIFGGGGKPAFAQMPSYTPVTRGGEQPQARPAAPRHVPYASPAPSQPAPQPMQPQNYSDPMTSVPQPHQGYAQPQAAPSYQPAPQNVPPPYPAQTYPAQSYPPQTYQQDPYPASPAYPAQNYQGQPQAPQNYQPQPQSPQNYQPSYQDASFPEADDADTSFADASFSGGSFPDGSFPDPTYADASFPQANGADASFPEELGYPADAPFAQDAPLELGAPNASFGQHVPPLPNYAGLQQGGAPSYGQAPMPGRQVAAFQSPYDQPPQVSLGASAQVNRQAQSFYESEQPDADFLGEAEIAAKETTKGPRISSLRNRSMVMVGAALLGAVALGGALAFAYKQSGGGIGAGQPPLVQADARPVKEVPDQPGGKDFPHKNKLIYDRLQNGDQPEADHLVPRQEELAMPAMPGITAAIPADGAPQTTQSVDAPAAVASTDDPGAAEDGGPRRVKTMKVTADGAMVDAEAPAQVASADAAQPQLAATAPAMPAAPLAAPAAATEPAEAAAAPAPAPAAKPKPAPKPAQVASADPAPQAAPAKPASYVVQLGSKKDQTEALASFADMQQKYPSLLANYRPMVQKADLGSKGTWYRLRIGPIADKGTASKLCSQLKAQGQSDCMVASQ